MTYAQFSTMLECGGRGMVGGAIPGLLVRTGPRDESWSWEAVVAAAITGLLVGLWLGRPSGRRPKGCALAAFGGCLFPIALGAMAAAAQHWAAPQAKDADPEHGETGFLAPFLLLGLGALAAFGAALAVGTAPSCAGLTPPPYNDEPRDRPDVGPPA